MKKQVIYKIIITALVFWLLDFIFHFTGVGESNYYYIIKMANALLFAFIWFAIYDKKSRKSKLFFSVAFGTWVSFFYIISSYSGIVQWLGIYARYSAPPFVVFGVYLTKYLWWVFHIIAFYVGLEVSSRLIKNKKK